MKKLRLGLSVLALLACAGFAVVARAAVQVSYSFADRFSEVHAVYRSLFSNSNGTSRSPVKTDEVVEVYATSEAGSFYTGMAELDLDTDGGLADELSAVKATCPKSGREDQGREEPLITDVDDLVALRLAGVTPAFVRNLARLGYQKLAPEELRSLRDNGVEIQLVQALSDSGYRNVSVEDLVRLRRSGVDEKFVRELQTSNEQ